MGTETAFKKELDGKTQWVEEVLKRHLPEETGFEKRVIEAMNYSLTAGGKRLRPLLMWEVYRMCGGEDGAVIEAFMAAVEMIHTYSLVHDDLPAMDNDEYRRGRKTTWCVYGDAMGILAGDGLLNYAFETALGALEACCRTEERLSDRESNVQPEGGNSQGERIAPPGSRLSREEQLAQLSRVSEALSVLAEKAGIRGMIGGQTADILAEGRPDVPGEELMFIHARKTAALIQAAMMIGAILAGASKEQVAAVEKCAYNVGIAFQIQDDILDVEGDSGELGKPTGSDDRNHKQTYVTWKGLEQAKEDVEALSREAVELLKGFEGKQTFLEQIILALIHRRM